MPAAAGAITSHDAYTEQGEIPPDLGCGDVLGAGVTRLERTLLGDVVGKRSLHCELP